MDRLVEHVNSYLEQNDLPDKGLFGNNVVLVIDLIQKKTTLEPIFSLDSEEIAGVTELVPDGLPVKLIFLDETILALMIAWDREGGKKVDVNNFLLLPRE